MAKPGGYYSKAETNQFSSVSKQLLQLTLCYYTPIQNILLKQLLIIRLYPTNYQSDYTTDNVVYEYSYVSMRLYFLKLF